MWEYKTLSLYVDWGAKEIEAAINKLGKDGWELVCVSNGIAYFKKGEVACMV